MLATFNLLKIVKKKKKKWHSLQTSAAVQVFTSTMRTSSPKLSFFVPLLVMQVRILALIKNIVKIKY